MEAFLMENILHLATVFCTCFFSIKAIQYQEVLVIYSHCSSANVTQAIFLSISMNKTLHHARTCTQSEPDGSLILNLKHFTHVWKCYNSTCVKHTDKETNDKRSNTAQQKTQCQQTTWEIFFISRHWIELKILYSLGLHDIQSNIYIGINSQI